MSARRSGPSRPRAAPASVRDLPGELSGREIAWRGRELAARGALLAVLALGCQAGTAPGAVCSRASDCSAPLVCAVGRCRSECVTSRDCPAGARCLADPSGGGSACSLAVVDDCEGGTACASGFVCRLGQCVNACGTVVRCPDGVCEGDACVPRPETDASTPDAAALDAAPDDAAVDATSMQRDAWSDDASATDAYVAPPDDAGADAPAAPDAFLAPDAAGSDGGCGACPMPTGGVTICVAGACEIDCGVLGAGDDGAWSHTGPSTCLWNAPALATLAPGAGTLAPAFGPGVTAYRLSVPLTSASVSFVVAHDGPMPSDATITVDGSTVPSGTPWTSPTLPLGASAHSVVVTALGGASRSYTVTIVRGFAPGHYVKASNTGMGDQLGISVAIDGDTMVVGAPLEDSAATTIDGDATNNGATDAGAAYVFVRAGGTWVQQAYLKPSNAEAGDQFGTSVAISGDTIVVGAPLEDGPATTVNGPQTNGAADAGAAYVFVRTGVAWSQQAYLKVTNTDGGDELGHAVAISGDTIVVGAPYEDSSATGVGGSQASNSRMDAGAAYVFARSGTTWSQQAYVKATNTDAGDVFGWSVAISGNTVVVGAIGEASAAMGVGGSQASNAAAGAGAAYVYFRTGSAWASQGYLKATNTGAGDWFGASVAISADTIVVGAPDEDSSARTVGGDGTNDAAANAGAAYVFVRSGATWSPQAYLKASNGAAGWLFGGAVAIDGDVIVIGAVGEASDATGVEGNAASTADPAAGAAYVLTRTGSAWSSAEYLKASNTDPMDHFGRSVDVSGVTIVVGAETEDSAATGVDGSGASNGASTSGACYLFEG